MMKLSNLKEQKKGITLIALVITIIVLLILAGVSIATLTGQNGILSKANLAKEKTNDKSQEEQEKLDDLNTLIESYGNGTVTPTKPKNEPTDIFVSLYSDGTLVFSNNEEPIEGKTLSKTYGNIKDKVFTYNSETKIVDTPWYDDRLSITTVNFANKIVPTTLGGMFCDCTNLNSIQNIENLETSEVTNMKRMFKNCVKLTSLDVSSFDTSKVTDMRVMFGGTSSNQMALTEIKGLENFKTSKVTDMEAMFQNCIKLTSLDLSGFNTSKVTNMSFMFAGGNNSLMSLTEIKGLENFKTSQVTKINSMFQNCVKLTSLDLSSFDTSKVTDMSFMFAGASSMALTEIKGLENFKTGEVANMEAMFQNGVKLTSLDLSGFNTSKVTNMKNMFCNCSSLKNIYVGQGWNLTSVTDQTNMYSNCSARPSVKT